MGCGCLTVFGKYISLSSSSCLSSFVFASSLVICWQNSLLHHVQVCPVKVSVDPARTFQLVLPLSSTSHPILPLCLLQRLPVSPFIMLRNPLILSLECLYPLNSLPSTSDWKLHTVSKFKLLGKKTNKTFCSPQQKHEKAGFSCCVWFTSRCLFSFSCVFACAACLHRVCNGPVRGRLPAAV